eukprot:TRINITY_DN1482_c0_g1_i10.p1 TRINITY_DN1482_c0_g1~~TRINITY_DN1482_c0_g1_i10.p1  ORF type:complete len:223 (+),score=33.85 TRINITY_DN1482_c0_g1_i10:31-699(+)
MDPEADLMDVETDPIVDLIPDDPNTPLTPSQARLLEIVSQHTDVDRFVANVAYFCKRHHSVRLAELEIRRDQDINKAKFVVALSAMISFFGPKPLSYYADMVVSSRFPFSEVPMRYERAGAVFRKAVRKLKMYPEKGLFAGLESLSAIFEPDRPDTADRISRWRNFFIETATGKLVYAEPDFAFHESDEFVYSYMKENAETYECPVGRIVLTFVHQACFTAR